MRLLLKVRLGDEGRRSGRLVLPDGGQGLLDLVVTRETVDARLDKNESKLGVGVLSVLLQVTANVDGLLDEVVEILRQLRGQASHLEDAQNLGSSHALDLGDAGRVTKHDADLRRSQTLLRVLENLLLHLSRGEGMR